MVVTTSTVDHKLNLKEIKMSVKIFNDSGEYQGTLSDEGQIKDTWRVGEKDVALSDAEDMAAKVKVKDTADADLAVTQEYKDSKKVNDSIELLTSFEDGHTHMINIFDDFDPSEGGSSGDMMNGFTNSTVGIKSHRHSHKVVSGEVLPSIKGGHTHTLIKPKA